MECKLPVEESWFTDSEMLNTRGRAFPKARAVEFSRLKAAVFTGLWITAYSQQAGSSLSPGPSSCSLHLAPLELVLGAWKCWVQTKPFRGLEAGWFRNSCQSASSCRKAQEGLFKQKTFPGIPSLRPNEPARLLVKVMFFSVSHLLK